MNPSKIIWFAIAGMLIAIILYNLTDDGYFERWKKESAGTIQDDIEFYLPLTGEDSFENPPCDYSSPAFSIISNSPRGIETCVQNIIWYPEGDYRSIYVIDSKGNYWSWSHFSIMNLSNMFWIPVAGLVLGIFIGSIVVLQTTPQEGKSEKG